MRSGLRLTTSLAVLAIGSALVVAGGYWRAAGIALIALMLALAARARWATWRDNWARVQGDVGVRHSPQTQRGGTLAGRTHPQYPTDVQVLVHTGGPRTSAERPELVWVCISGEIESGCYSGSLLNQPHQLSGLDQGDTIEFVVPRDPRHPPVMVTDQYLAEISHWVVSPCDTCGSTVLLDPPSALIDAAFPNLPPGSVPEMFTTFCGLCGGGQVVHLP